MATTLNSQMTPFKLYQALEDARRRGGPTDYYGLGKAITGVGDSWDAMQRTMSNSMRLQDQEAQMNARQDAGYYPAQAQRDASQFNLGAFESTNKLQAQQDIQNAFKQALAAGRTPGTPEFELAMRSQLTTQGAVVAKAKDVATAQQQLQSQALQMAIVKKGVEDEIKRKLKEEFINTHGESFKAYAIANGEPESAVMSSLRRVAEREALRKLQTNQVQVNIDPATGMITAADADGSQIQIDPSVLATAFATTGNKDGFNALQNITKGAYMYGGEPRIALEQMKQEHQAKLKELDTVRKKELAEITAQARKENARIAAEAKKEAKRTEYDSAVSQLYKLELELAKARTKEGADISGVQKQVDDARERVDRMKSSSQMNTSFTPDADIAAALGGSSEKPGTTGGGVTMDWGTTGATGEWGADAVVEEDWLGTSAFQ